MIEFSNIINEISEKLTAWWNHEDQKNPCIIASVLKDNHGAIPDTDDLELFWTDTNFVTSRTCHIIDNTIYFGQAVPYHYVDFGSSAMCCALGATPGYIDKETIWAHPHLDSLDQVADIRLDRRNFCYHTILEITRRSVEKSYNHHLVAPFALNGIGDILAGVYGTEKMLIDMSFQPGRVKFCLEHLKRLWIQAFEEVQHIIQQSGNKGGINWAGIWSPGTTFPIQEDFSYMISPEMFHEFCIPHIHDIVDVLEYPFYHLDGIGAISHVDELLKIDKLKAIQWQPGAGKEALIRWYDLLKYILSKGKSVQVYAKVEEIEDLVKNVGAKGLLIIITNATREKVERLIEKYRNSK